MIIHFLGLCQNARVSMNHNRGIGMTRLSCFIVVLMLAVSGTLDREAYARGFGGGGGGFGGGGFRGFGGGGGFDRGGFDRGGYGGGFDRGGFGDEGRFGSGGGFGRSDMGNYGGFGQRDSSAFRGNDVGGWNRGNFDNGNGGQNANRFNGSVNRSQLNNFLSLPTDGGLGGAAGALSNRGLSPGNLVANTGTHPFSQTWAHSQGQNIQNWASNHPEAMNAWNNGRNSWAWTPNGVDAALWGAAVWGTAGWPTLDNWLGWGGSTDYPYDYGNNITYDGDNVYYNSQPAGTAEQYYQEASNLASTTSSTPSDSSSGDWLPLGIFGLVEGDSKTPTRTFQIALNKEGTIRGNSTNQYGNILPIHGAVQKRTQRVCWTVGTDTGTVYDTGLYNLTKSESSILVHTGPKQTQQELLVRIKQPAAQSGNGSLSSTK
jgi:hypothetical protein